MMFKIFALKNCEYCKRAVEELRLQGLPFFYCPMDGPPNGPPISVTLEMIKEKYNWPTVPIVIRVEDDDELLIGGYSDLVEFLNEKSSV